MWGWLTTEQNPRDSFTWRHAPCCPLKKDAQPIKVALSPGSSLRPVDGEAASRITLKELRQRGKGAARTIKSLCWEWGQVASVVKHQKMTAKHERGTLEVRL